jgi:hypothetical protein
MNSIEEASGPPLFSLQEAARASRSFDWAEELLAPIRWPLRVDPAPTRSIEEATLAERGVC